MTIQIAKPETIAAALEAAELREVRGRIEPDLERIKIIKRVQATGQADLETINKWRTDSRLIAK